MFGKPLHVQTDAGLESVGKFTDIMKEFQIKQVVTCSVSPWANGIADITVHFVKSLHKNNLKGRPKD